MPPNPGTAGEWPECVHSIVRFELSKKGKGAALSFDQIGHPENHYDHLAEGWVKMVWEPMRALLRDAPKAGEAAQSLTPARALPPSRTSAPPASRP